MIANTLSAGLAPSTLKGRARVHHGATIPCGHDVPKQQKAVTIDGTITLCF